MLAQHALLRNAKRLLDSELKEAANLGKLVLEQVDHSDIDPAAVLSEARQYLASAERLLETLQDASDELVEQLLDAATLHAKLGNLAAATIALRRASELAKELNNVSLELSSLHALGTLECKKGNYGNAREHFELAASIAKTEGLVMFELSALDELAKLAASQGDYEGASEYYLAGLELAREADEARLLELLEALGQLHLKFGEPEEALPHLHEVLALAQYAGFSERLTHAHAYLADCYEALSDYKMALEHQRAFHEAEARQTQGQIITTTYKDTALDTPTNLPQRLEKQALLQAERLAVERTAELEAEQLDAVSRLAVAAEYRDDDTGEHTRRVGRNAAALAHVLGWKKEAVERIYIAARLHDVGKIGVSDLILHKAGKLTPEEFEAIKIHTTIGAEILAAGKSELLKMAEEIALAHHERWDGKGYPYGVAAQDIPLVARIVAVADVLDALTHVRPYKPAWTLEEALSEIERGSGTQFDPQVVRACFKVFGFRKLSPTEFEESLEETLQKMADLGLEP